jgi:hypothetical protein
MTRLQFSCKLWKWYVSNFNEFLLIQNVAYYNRSYVDHVLVQEIVWIITAYIVLVDSLMHGCSKNVKYLYTIIGYVYGTHQSIPIFIWLILNDEYEKKYWRLKNLLKYFEFLLYFNISIISFTFDENSWDIKKK